MNAPVWLAAILTTIGAMSAHALEIDLPGEEQRIEAAYTCENGTKLDVEFINVGENSLAVVRIDGADPLVFANVIAASGARYTGGVYELWEARGEVTFTKAGEDPTTCKP